MRALWPELDHSIERIGIGREDHDQFALVEHDLAIAPCIAVAADVGLPFILDGCRLRLWLSGGHDGRHHPLEELLDIGER